MAFRWRVDDGQLIVVFWSSLTSSTRKKNAVRFRTPTPTKISGSARDAVISSGVGLCSHSIRFCWPGLYLHSIEEGKDQESIQSSQSHTWSRTPHGKVTKHKKTSHTREPRGKPFPSRWQQGCNEQARQNDRQKGSTKKTALEWSVKKYWRA